MVAAIDSVRLFLALALFVLVLMDAPVLVTAPFAALVILGLFWSAWRWYHIRDKGWGS